MITRHGCGIVVVAVLALGLVACDSQAEIPTRVPRAGIWISREEVLALPMTGPAWEAIARYARTPTPHPDLSNQNDPTNVRVLAKALYAIRTGDADAAREVALACERIQGTEKGASALAVSRELMAYVIAADLIDLEPAQRRPFEAWLRRVRDENFRGRTIRSTHEDRPNNWGTHAGATRLALAIYLDDQAELQRAARVFRGWTGDAKTWPGFAFGKLWWQADPSKPRAVNPPGALREGHPIGGVLPDDQRRGGPFRWPPPHENYVYEALQGAVAQAVLLERQGYDAWQWGDRAVLRAFEWLQDIADFPAEGDDTWMPPIVNRVYGKHFPAPVPSQPGKAMGFGDWTHAQTPRLDPKPPEPAPTASDTLGRVHE